MIDESRNRLSADLPWTVVVVLRTYCGFPSGSRRWQAKESVETSASKKTAARNFFKVGSSRIAHVFGHCRCPGFVPDRREVPIDTAGADGRCAAAGHDRRHVELLQRQIEFETASIASANAKNRHLAAWQRFAAAASVPEMKPVRLNGELVVESKLLDWKESLSTILSKSSELAAARIAVEPARAPRVR